MNLHPGRAAGDRRSGVAIHALQKVKPHASGVLGGNRRPGRPDQQCRPRTLGRCVRFPRVVGPMKIARESALGTDLAVLHLQQSDIQLGLAIASKLERAHHLYQADHGRGGDVIGHFCPPRDQHTVARPGHPSRPPGLGLRPAAIGDRPDREGNRGFGAFRLIRRLEHRRARQQAERDHNTVQ